jgi:hypothetical protein
MPRRSRELWYAFTAMVLLGLGYVLIVRRLDGVPPAGSLIGHSLGVAGFVLMLMTEILYSLRKRSRRARWGRTATWLRFHILTGLVGPFLVLLHTSWKYNGLAGIVALMTAVVVLSGFIGRYIYTAVPRTIDGAEVEAGELESKIAAVEAELEAWGWGARLAWWREKQHMDPAARDQATKMDRLLSQHSTLRRQVASLTLTRQMLAVWRTVHIPIGMVLFAAAFIHIGAAIYYATLLR